MIGGEHADLLPRLPVGKPRTPRGQRAPRSALSWKTGHRKPWAHTGTFQALTDSAPVTILRPEGVAFWHESEAQDGCAWHKAFL
jgi:hypothetical protein